MPSHYVYRMDHDTGFAPNTDYGICTLSGCKTTTVEKWAGNGSWVIGIGGNGTGKPDKLIYAMEVEESLPYQKFRKRYPRKSGYLQGKSVANVLVSRKFYYFGENAIDLPNQLRHIIIDRQGCRRIGSEDVGKLKKYLATRYHYGKLGDPSNTQLTNLRVKCQCVA